MLALLAREVLQNEPKASLSPAPSALLCTTPPVPHCGILGRGSTTEPYSNLSLGVLGRALPLRHALFILNLIVVSKAISVFAKMTSTEAQRGLVTTPNHTATSI